MIPGNILGILVNQTKSKSLSIHVRFHFPCKFVFIIKGDSDRMSWNNRNVNQAYLKIVTEDK